MFFHVVCGLAGQHHRALGQGTPHVVLVEGNKTLKDHAALIADLLQGPGNGWEVDVAGAGGALVVVADVDVAKVEEEENMKMLIIMRKIINL